MADAKPVVAAAPASTFTVPAFDSIGKAASDVIGRDFYHGATLLSVSLAAPNGVKVTTKGKSPLDGSISGSVDLKKKVIDGVTVTNTWSTSNALATRVEVDEKIAQGVRVDFTSLFSPEKGSKGNKLGIFFEQPKFYARAFLDHSTSGKLHASVDGVVGHDGYLAGAEAGYDVQKAAVTNYAFAAGYFNPAFSASLAATKNLGFVTASYYQKVNGRVEAGVRATYSTKDSRTTNMEIAAKYKVDSLSFVKAKVDKDGLACVSYNTKINSGVTLGLGAQIDTQRLNDSGHKLGASFTFES